MPVITLNAEFSFDIADIDDETLGREVRRRDELWKKIESAILEDKTVSIDDFSSQDLIAELQERSVETPRHWDVDLYRMIAEGRNSDALDLLYKNSTERLAPPSTETGIADLLAGRKASSNVRN